MRRLACSQLPLSSVLGLHASPGRAALAVPIAVAVAVIAGLIPAWLAALAAVNVLRTPGRAAVGAISLAVGATALTVVAAAAQLAGQLPAGQLVAEE